MTFFEAFDKFMDEMQSYSDIQTVVLHPDAYRRAVEEAMKLDHLTQVRMTPNRHLMFIYKGIFFMKGKYAAANDKESQQ